MTLTSMPTSLVPGSDSSVTQESETATLVRAPGSTQPLAAVVRLISSGAPSRGFRIRSGKCVIGSAADCDVVVADPTVSRRHVELQLVPEGVAVRDLDSRNGTFHLGQRLQQMVLSPGARLTIGAAEIAIDLDADSLHREAIHPDESFRGMVGRSLALRRIFATVARLDGSLVPVLITGESGVGKELLARAIHEGSRVAEGPFVAVNCGAIARELVASELFGHKRGAYTGAVQSRRGAFETAAGGTLFLDEIGELSLDVQPMLLRALECGEIRAVGADEGKQVRVRCVAATNRDLQRQVAEGRFREDLYYRLAVVALRLPSLRERPEDVEPLARLFASAAGLAELPVAVIEQLMVRPWPGNARELRNAIQAYAALGTLPEPLSAGTGALDGALQQGIDLHRPYAEQKEALCERFTRHYLRALMAHTAGNQSAAAKLAGLDRSYLGRLLSKHGTSR
jgi:DNA-binding NtrC family response regulator